MSTARTYSPAGYEGARPTQPPRDMEEGYRSHADEAWGQQQGPTFRTEASGAAGHRSYWRTTKAAATESWAAARTWSEPSVSSAHDSSARCPSPALADALCCCDCASFSGGWRPTGGAHMDTESAACLSLIGHLCLSALTTMA
jgi:hypothetical protein